MPHKRMFNAHCRRKAAMKKTVRKGQSAESSQPSTSGCHSNEATPPVSAVSPSSSSRKLSCLQQGYSSLYEDKK